MTATPETGALERLVGFGRDLRRRGLDVGTDRVVTFCRAAAALGTLDRRDVYWSGRATLVARPEDVEVFDEAFDAWFREDLRLEVPATAPERLGADAAGRTGRHPSVGHRALGETDETHVDEGAGDAPLARVVASAAEILREKSFADLTEEERARVARLIRRLGVQVPVRPTRRYRPVASGPRFDMRRTLRRSLRTQGEPFHRAWRERGSRSRPLVLVLDISGSMAPYSRALVQFGFAAMAAGRRVEVFVFGTRLTRVTRMLATTDPTARSTGSGGSSPTGRRDPDRGVAEDAARRVEPAGGAPGLDRRDLLGRARAR